MKIRPITDADWPAFASFAAENFGASHTNNRAFNDHWFRRSGIAPDTDRKLNGWTGLMVEGSDGAFVGAMMMIVVKAWFAGEAVPMAWISTGVVNEDGRALGAGAGLYMWIYRNFPLVGGLSGNAFSMPINNLLGQDIPGLTMRRFIYVHGANAVNLCLPESQAEFNAVHFDATNETGSSIQSRWSTAVPDGHKDVWAAFRDTVVCTTNRSPEHLQWRFADEPYLDYRFLDLHDGNRSRGLAVVRFQTTPAGLVCRIVDFMADPVFATDCWRQVATACADAGALFSDFQVIGTNQNEALQKAGYLSPDDVPALGALPNLLSPVDHRKWTNSFHMGGSVAKKNQSWRSPDAVYFTKADSDRDWSTPYDLETLGVTPEST